MKKNLFLFLIAIGMLFSIRSFAAPGNSTLSGTVYDKTSGNTIPFAVIFFPDLKIGTQSDLNGKYELRNLPRGKFLVQVKAVGFATDIETIALDSATVRDFRLGNSVKEVGEVVVTGQATATGILHTPTPISIVSHDELLRGTSTNIIDALAKQPNIAQLGTGVGISKPVIRGLGYNRVVVVNDGIRQEGQQWGDEHGIEVDEYSVNRVEILKGPASLAYGSDAMAGVINLLTAPTLPEGTIRGTAIANYQTNNGLIGYSADVAGNAKGFTWDARYSAKQAHAYQDKYDGYVFNSGFLENAASGIIGLNKSWGFMHLHFGMYQLQPGMVEGERDSLGRFVKAIKINDTTAGETVATNDDFHSYKLSVPRQNIRHYKAVLNNSFVTGNGRVNATLGFQQNQRQEFGDVLTNYYGLYFLMNTINYDLRYIFQEENGLQVSFGANGMQQDSKNKGTEYLVPDYNLFDVGVFGILRKSFKNIDLSGGLRYDNRSEKTGDLFLDSTGVNVGSEQPGAEHHFTSFHRNFGGVSGSFGIAYKASENATIKLNVSRGFRAPNIAELGSNGEHEGTIRYETGNPDLKPESSSQLDAALVWSSEHFNFEVDGFANTIDNFIFPVKLASAFGGDSIRDGYTAFKYVQSDAFLSGAEVTFDLHPHPLDWLHVEGNFGMVKAVQPGQTDSTLYLPYTPAPRVGGELRANLKKGGKLLSDAYFKIEVNHTFAQNRVYYAYGTETPTPAYTLIDLGAGTDIVTKEKTRCSIYFVASNITDVAYQSHLSRLKYAPENLATGRMGVFNMGRNFSVKLVVPIEGKLRADTAQ